MKLILQDLKPTPKNKIPSHRGKAELQVTQKVPVLKRLCIISSVFFAVLIGYSGCATILNPVFQLVAFAIQLPFRILGMAFQMIPYAIRYAPLALLFIDNSQYDVDTYYASLPEGHQVMTLPSGVYCVILPTQDEAAIQEIAEIAMDRKDRMTFLKGLEMPVSEAYLTTIYRELYQNGLYLAMDSRLEIPAEEKV